MKSPKEVWHIFTGKYIFTRGNLFQPADNWEVSRLCSKKTYLPRTFFPSFWYSEFIIHWLKINLFGIKMTCWTQIGRVTLIRLLCYVWLLFYILSYLLYWILDFVIIYAISATLLGLLFYPVSMNVQDSWITLSAYFALSLLALEEKAQTLPDATSPIAKIHPSRQLADI